MVGGLTNTLSLEETWQTTRRVCHLKYGHIHNSNHFRDLAHHLGGIQLDNITLFYCISVLYLQLQCTLFVIQSRVIVLVSLTYGPSRGLPRKWRYRYFKCPSNTDPNLEVSAELVAHCSKTRFDSIPSKKKVYIDLRAPGGIDISKLELRLDRVLLFPLFSLFSFLFRY